MKATSISTLPTTGSLSRRDRPLPPVMLLPDAPELRFEGRQRAAPYPTRVGASGQIRGQKAQAPRTSCDGLRGALRPELVRGVLVPGIGPHLDDLAISNVEDLHGVVLKVPAFALGGAR
jgi:hypothetical protein